MKRIKKHYKKIWVAISIVAFFVALLMLPFLNRIYPNIYVAGIYLGDKTKDSALEYFSEQYKIPSKLNLVINGQKNELLTSEIVTDIDYKGSIDRAFNYSNSGNLLSDFLTRLNLIFKPINLSASINFNEEELLETLLIISDKAGTKPVYPSLKKINNLVVVDPGKDGVEIDIKKARADIGQALTLEKNDEVQINFKEIKSKLTDTETTVFKLTAEKFLGAKIELKSEFDVITLSDETLLSFLTPKGYSDEVILKEILKIARNLNRNPQDSVFVIENGVVKEFISSKEGITVNNDKLTQEIKNSLDEISKKDKLVAQIEIPTFKVSPKIKNEDVNDLGINTLLGRGNSNFKGSIPNRIYNVNLAQSKFKGVLVPPNEIVSFNDILGDVSAYTGYKSAYVIMDGKTVLGDGGGVCQVSTTLFRAVLSAGLPVIERRAHAYRVGYYEQGFAPGLDATVYSPTTDFKFKNDTPAYLLIQPTIDLNSLALTFEIYGTSDGRVATTTKPVIASSIAPGEDQYIDDPTLPAGTIKQIEHRAYGAKVVFDYNVTRNGESLIDKTFVSNYRPWRAVYLRGTGQ